jgi:allantoicase
MHFGDMQNIIKSGTAIDMSDGWETRRRRGPGYDWVIIKLGTASEIEQIVVDTLHFKGNFPDSCSIEGCFEPNANSESILLDNVAWMEILPKNKLKSHTEHIFNIELKNSGQCTHLRLNIFPDGGVSRLRIFGRPIT